MQASLSGLSGATPLRAAARRDPRLRPAPYRSPTDKSEDDPSIKFRPSPNFKHMKKYLKSKFEEDLLEELKKSSEKISQKNKVKTVNQPPLPPNSPPPGSPEVAVKEEIKDEEYERSGELPLEELSSPTLSSPTLSAPMLSALREGESGGRQDWTMCKDWVRNTCTRGASCIYTHKVDKAQLKEVYRFCRDFANKRCTRPVCYFAHATTFETEHFLRTAYLPPHATAHLRPPGATAASGDLQAEMTQTFGSPPAPSLASGAGVPPATVVAGAGAMKPPLALDASMLAASPASAMSGAGGLPGAPAMPGPSAMPGACAMLGAPAVAGAQGALAGGACSTLSKKRFRWTDANDFSSLPDDLEAKEPLAKMCKHCDLNKIRSQHLREQLALEMRWHQDLDDQLEKISKKSTKLVSMLKMLLRPKRATPLESIHSNENFLGANRYALMEEDNNSLLMSQMKVLLTVLLGGDALPADIG